MNKTYKEELPLKARKLFLEQIRRKIEDLKWTN